MPQKTRLFMHFQPQIINPGTRVLRNKNPTRPIGKNPGLNPGWVNRVHSLVDNVENFKNIRVSSFYQYKYQYFQYSFIYPPKREIPHRRIPSSFLPLLSSKTHNLPLKGYFTAAFLQLFYLRESHSRQQLVVEELRRNSEPGFATVYLYLLSTLLLQIRRGAICLLILEGLGTFQE